MRTWLITGASSGIGRKVAERLLARGDSVVAGVRRAATLDDLAAAHGERLRVATFDLADTAAMRGAVDAAFAEGGIDVVFGNAGFGTFGAAEELSDEQVERQIAANLTGSIHFLRACLPHLRDQGGGRIIQSSSEGGQIAYPGFGAYHASKWGIEGFVEALAKEVAPFGIDAVIVEPGPTPTSFGANVDSADRIAEYDGTPAHDVRTAIESGGFELTGDADGCADAIVALGDADRVPLRLALGRTAYASIEAALVARLAEHRANRDATLAADAPGGA